MNLFPIEKLKQKNVLAISGAKGTGKTTLASALKYNDSNRALVAFADPLKKMLSKYYNIPNYILHDPDMKESPFVMPDGTQTTYRQLMQSFGTDLGRGINKGVWTTLALIDIIHTPADLVIVHDLRMLNEYEELLKWTNVRTIRIHRDTDNDDHHVTENELFSIPYDFVLDNSSDIISMVNKAEDFIKEEFV